MEHAAYRRNEYATAVADAVRKVQEPTVKRCWWRATWWERLCVRVSIWRGRLKRNPYGPQQDIGLEALQCEDS